MKEKFEAVHKILQDDWYVTVVLDVDKNQGYYMGDIPEDEETARRFFYGVLDVINRTYKSKFHKDLIRGMNKKFKVKSCVQTCSACPSQWNIYTTDGQYIYARYRWGGLTLTLNMGQPDSKVIYSEGIGDGLDGVLSTQELKDHTDSILDWSLM